MRSLAESLAHIYRTEGLLGLWKGSVPSIVKVCVGRGLRGEGCVEKEREGPLTVTVQGSNSVPQRAMRAAGEAHCHAAKGLDGV